MSTVEFTPLFHVPGPGPYALTHSVGCLPRASTRALENGFIRPWEQTGGDAWPDWLQRIEDFRTALGALLGGKPAEYCPQVNLSAGLTKVLSAMPVRGRRVLLASEESFPSLGFVLEQAKRIGYERRLISREHDPADIHTWSQALTSDTRAVLVTHVHSNTGRIAPVAEIAGLCAERDILCIVDVAQSAGILPFSVHELGADVVLGSCIKWLCGGPGAGFLWVRQDLVRELEPADVGWFSHEAPFEMDIHSFRYADDARRFWGGTPSIAPFVLAAESLRCIQQIGVSAIRAHNQQLTQAFREALPVPWRGRIPTGDRGGTLCIPTGSDFGAVRDGLTAAGVRFDTRGDTIRLSFHACNRLADALHVARAWSGGH